MTLVNTPRSNVIKILSYIVALVFGIVLGNFEVCQLQCKQTRITTKCLQESDAFVSKSYASRAINHSFSLSVQRNLVITAAVNSEILSVYRFARSVRQSCIFCQLRVIVADAAINDKDFQELAKIYSIVYVPFDDFIPMRWKAQQNRVTKIHSSRWIIIKNYLLNLQIKGEIFDNVFICDSHDTIFQKDIFEYMNVYTPGLYVFMEDIRMTIGTCLINSDWIRTCYGDAELNRLFNKSISCSGTVLGEWFAIMSYLSAMESEILSTPTACKRSIGSDQGIHNYIVHNNEIFNTTVHYISHEYGFVGTLGYVQWMKRNQFGQVQNVNGSVYAVIHQWNRSKQMIEQLQGEYKIIPAGIRDKIN